MANPIENTIDVIDSRNVIDRIEELEAELRERHEAGGFTSSFDDWIANSRDDSDPVHTVFPNDSSDVVEQIEELCVLRKLAEEGEHSSDWSHGEALVRESYFTDYIEDLVKDCYEMPKALNSGTWPWCHMTMDWEGAAEAAKVDYNEVSFGGETYLIRA